MTDDLRVHATAAKAAIGSAMGQWDAYDWGEWDGKNPPAIYALVSVDLRYSPPDRQGRSSLVGGRINVLAVGNTPNEARKAAAWVSQALNGVHLPIGSGTTSPVSREFQTDARPDSGRYSADSSWTYTL